MRALLSVDPGGPETLVMTVVPDPMPAPDQVIVAVSACAINYPDVLIIEDRYQTKPERPFAPGGEIAGIVDSIGADVTDWKVGDRIMGVIGHGGLAEKVAVDPARLYRLPANRSFSEGAALILTYGTVIHALTDRGHLRAGQHLLVLGAAGGVGLAAVELGKAFGAIVTAAVSTEAKGDAAREAGADTTIIYPPGPFDKDQAKALARQIKNASGASGFDVVFDPVGGSYAEAALRAIAWEGRYLVVGFPAGIPRMPLNLALLKSCDICGVFWGAAVDRDPLAERVRIEHLFRLWADRLISPRITDVFPFLDAGKAIAKMAERGAIGKMVVDLRA